MSYNHNHNHNHNYSPYLNPSAPSESMLNDEAAMLEHYSRQARQQQSHHHNADDASVMTTTTVDRDAAFAQRLQQEEQDAQLARDVELQLRREERLQQQHSQAARDAAYARQLEQTEAANANVNNSNNNIEAHVSPESAQLQSDEDLARQYALAEERALQAREQRAARAANTPSFRRRCCTTVIPCAIVGIGMLTLWLVLRARGEEIAIPGFGEGEIFNGGPWLQDSDPFDGMTPDEVAKWRNRGGTNEGLALTIVNALSNQYNKDWNDIFTAVVNDWDDGDPDALVLTVQTVEADPKCDAISGTSKVCNGNYGATEWKGINVAILQMNYIVASTSKMNEYYLARASEAQRRYTMCHELGHSFGLPHTDEDFFNRDLGNCMDYTSNPAANQQPDQTNYQFLADLYGKIPSENKMSAAPVGDADPETLPEDVEQDGKPPKEEGGGTRRRSLRRQQRQPTSIPADIQAKLQEVLPAMENYNDNNTPPPPHKWRMLHSSKQGQAHELELGNGWKVQMHKLHALNHDDHED